METQPADTPLTTKEKVGIGSIIAIGAIVGGYANKKGRDGVGSIPLGVILGAGVGLFVAAMFYY